MEQEKRKRRTKKAFRNFKSWSFFLIFVTCASVTWNYCIAGWLWMNHSGQSRLSQKQEAVPELMQQAESEAESEMMLEAGSIRYHGKRFIPQKRIF